MRAHQILADNPKRERQEQFIYNIRKVPLEEFQTSSLLLKNLQTLFDTSFYSAKEFMELCELLRANNIKEIAVTPTLRDCEYKDVEREQYEARITYYILKSKNKIISCIKTFAQLKQLPYQVISAILCKPNPQLENYVKTPQQLIELLNLFQTPSPQFEMVVESINLNWLMRLIKNVDQLLSITSRMAGTYQILFLNCLDNEWLENLTGISKNKIDNEIDFSKNLFYQRYHLLFSKLEFLNPDIALENKPDNFMSPVLKEKISTFQNLSMQEIFILTNFQRDELNMSDESVARVEPSQNYGGVDWNTIGMFALGVGAVAVAGACLAFVGKEITTTFKLK